jgi:ATP-dependent protease HslVU (ClpYQ) ATPase subunit
LGNTTSFLGPNDFEELASIVRQLVDNLVTEKVEQEKQTIDVRVEQYSEAKAVKKLKASRAWAEAEEKRRELLKQRNEFYRSSVAEMVELDVW